MITHGRSSKYFAKSKLNLKFMNYVTLYLAYICRVLIENLITMTFVSLYYVIYLGQVKLNIWKPQVLLW